MERLQAAIEKARAQRDGAVQQATPPAPPPAVSGLAEPAAPAVQAADSVTALWRALKPVDTSVPAFEEGGHLVAWRGGAQATPYDMLRTRILQQALANNWRRIAVVSPHSGCGKTTTVANLAFSFARQSDLRTLVIDFDLRRATLARMLGQTPTHTMGEVLEGQVSFADHGLGHGDNLAFGLNSGPVRQSAELLHSQRAKDSLAAVEALYRPDVVLFDVPPLQAADDSIGFLKSVDCALLVVAAEETPMGQIDVAERQVSELTGMLGLVLNKCRMSGGDYGYEYYDD